MTTQNKPVREIIVKHVFNASRATVFKAWIDPKYLAVWWGPHGFTNPVCEIDPRPGGGIRIHMRGPDGTVYPMSGVYREIVEPERLVFTSVFPEKGEAVFEILNTVTFVEDGGKTLVTVDARVIKATAEADFYLQGMEKGWVQQLERLAEFLRGQ
jgi:uncharacterized protein YndB with AHSA1/START domain